MNVYVESNFVLEVALAQEQATSCENILALCNLNKAHLIIPAYCLVEPYETVVRRAKSRRKLATDLTGEIQQLTRSEPYKDKSEILQNITGWLISSVEEEKKRLDRTIERLLRVAEIISLETAMLSSALSFQDTLGLSPQDSLVYAAVIQHIASSSSEQQRCFLNRNSYDFDDQNIVATFTKYNCRVIARFDSGYNYIQNQVGG